MEKDLFLIIVITQISSFIHLLDSFVPVSACVLTLKLTVSPQVARVTTTGLMLISKYSFLTFCQLRRPRESARHLVSGENLLPSP